MLDELLLDELVKLVLEELELLAELLELMELVELETLDTLELLSEEETLVLLVEELLVELVELETLELVELLTEELVLCEEELLSPMKTLFTELSPPEVLLHPAIPHIITSDSAAAKNLDFFIAYQPFFNSSSMTAPA